MIITADLSTKGFDGILKELQKVKTKLPAVNAAFIKHSLDWLEDRARFHVRDTVGKTGYDPTGELENFFRKYVEDTVGILRNEAPYAAFVEYGTGIVGKGSPHEFAGEVGWTYDVNNHGEAGWVYQDEQGNYWRTRGMAAHRFMYNALMDYLYQGGKEECIKKAFGELG